MKVFAGTSRIKSIMCVFQIDFGQHEFLILAPNSNFTGQIISRMNSIRNVSDDSAFLVYFEEQEKKLILESELAFYPRVWLAVRVERTIEVYSTNPSDLCDKMDWSSPALSATCSSNKELFIQSSLHRNLDFSGCRLKVGTVINAPNTIYPSTSMPAPLFMPLNNLTGLEINLLDMIAEHLNMSTEYYIFDELNVWGIVYSTNNFTGMYQLLNNRSMDVLIGSLYITWLRTQVFDMTIPFLTVKYTSIIKFVNLITSSFVFLG